MNLRVGVLCGAAVLATACGNGYQFSPVGHCVVQPGTTDVRVSSISSADILFVVDDSPSMEPKQTALAASFGNFIARVVQTNTDRVARGLEPIDFHIAVTTSSIFLANPSGQYCQGGNACCAPSACAAAPSCTPGTALGCGAGQLCITAPLLAPTYGTVGPIQLGEQTQCCDVSACAPSATGCFAGDQCPAMVTHYPSPTPGNCRAGVSAPGAPFGAGAFVSAPGNPKVLDFGKTLDWASWGTAAQDPRLTTLVQQFQQNVQVGSCGSGEEQHLEAARLALRSALAGTQPGVVPGSWPHPGAKLVVVWVGDEDDCSSPPSAPLVLVADQPGADSCVWDKHRPAGAQREYPIAGYASYFTGLVRSGGPADFAAAFIASAARCADGSFAPADQCAGTPSCPVQPPLACNPPAPVCAGAYAAGERFFALADAIRAKGYQVVEGTVCDAYQPDAFGQELSAIADLALPPDALKLATLPEAAQVTVLRIVGTDGQTRRICTQGTDWCFVDCADGSATPACLAPGATSQCIAIARGGACQANPGETYSAQYLGVVPAGGCATDADCQAALGGSPSVWSCYTAPGQTRGTCLCGK